jgi:uncharacterized protein
MKKGPISIFAVIVTCCALDHALAAQTSHLAPHPSGCAAAAFLTTEKGKLAGVDWVERKAGQVHTRAVLTQSRIIDATIDLRPDETAAHVSVTLAVAGEHPEKPTMRDLGTDAIYWSPMIVSSIEQAVARARVLDQQTVTIPGASLFRDARSSIIVIRLDPHDWIVRYQDLDYEVLTDDNGCMLSASLPQHGVTIERRSDFASEKYPLWGPYSAPPDGAYNAVHVSIPAPQGHVLVGTLTTPKRKALIPALVLITGLSPHERNNGAPPWMPFRDIADSLTRAGIAVLRVDDRGVGSSTGDRTQFTISDKVEDMRTEVAWLRSRQGIDPKRVGVIGYSEGGLVARMVAARDPRIAAVVTLAGPGVPGPEVARYQVEQLILRNGNISESERPKTIETKLAEALKDLTPHERTYLETDPIPYDSQVHCPALIIQGGTDADVPIRSAERIANAIRASGNEDVTVRLFPSVSHSLLPDPNGLSSGWVALPGFLTSPELLEEMTHWAVSKLFPPAHSR